MGDSQGRLTKISDVVAMILLRLTISTASCEYKDTHANLSGVIDTIEELGVQTSWSQNLIFRVSLVIEEHVQNVIDHAYADRPSDTAAEDSVEIVITSTGDKVIIDVSDRRPAFNPLTEVPEPDLMSSVEDRRIGGLGVHFMRTLLDEITYTREDGENRLKMVIFKLL